MTAALGLLLGVVLWGVFLLAVNTLFAWVEQRRALHVVQLQRRIAKHVYGAR